MARANVNFWDSTGEKDLVLACGGTEDDKHMVEMELVTDAATPYGECPICGNRSFLGRA